ncbi:MAG TPA: SulP family inorganic anion transporter [Candidatus Saccharimonadales bacterium]|nr:SulP family inorganic anion transporter [Candidatus Saccharimonadales bacterium]
MFEKVKKSLASRFHDVVKYKKQWLWPDLGAGLTVGIVALPLSLALAIAVGVPPILGLYTAAVAGLSSAFFAGSPYSVSGPAAAMVPILAVAIQEHGLNNLPFITILAGIFLGIFAVLGIGKLIRKIPEPIVLGFTIGVAVVIFMGQLNSFLGLTGLAGHDEFVGKVYETLSHIGATNLASLAIGALTLLAIVFLPKVPVIGKIPSTLIAVTGATVAVATLPFLNGVATLGSVYGALQLGLPPFIGGDLDFSKLLDFNLWPAALEIAALIAIESLLCALVADRITKSSHRSGQELAAQGIANISSALFGGIPATAVIARTGTNIKNGAKSRLASIIHALVVIIFLVALAPVAALIPLTALSAVLIVTAYKIAEIKEVRHFVLTKGWRLATVLLTTMILTIFIDLVVGVGTGLIAYFILIVAPNLLDSELGHRIKRQFAFAKVKIKR